MGGGGVCNKRKLDRKINEPEKGISEKEEIEHKKKEVSNGPTEMRNSNKLRKSKKTCTKNRRSNKCKHTGKTGVEIVLNIITEHLDILTNCS
jgi:hypothetical protein